MENEMIEVHKTVWIALQTWLASRMILDIDEDGKLPYYTLSKHSYLEWVEWVINHGEFVFGVDEDNVTLGIRYIEDKEHANEI